MLQNRQNFKPLIWNRHHWELSRYRNGVRASFTGYVILRMRTQIYGL